MHHTAMLNFRLRAELGPDRDRVCDWCSDVRRLVGLFVTQRLVPAMLVLLANIVAARIVMILAKVQRVDSAAPSVNQRVAQCSRQPVETSLDENGVARIGLDLHAKFHRRRVILVIRPRNVLHDPLGRVIQEGLEICLVHGRDVFWSLGDAG